MDTNFCNRGNGTQRETLFAEQFESLVRRCASVVKSFILFAFIRVHSRFKF